MGRILIIQDSPSVNAILKFRLEAGGFSVETVETGEEGIEKIKGDNYQLVLLDYMLPRMNGYKICQLLKTDPKYRSIPVILSSGRTPQEIQKVGKEVGADAYVSKPFEAEALLNKIQELLERRGK